MSRKVKCPTCGNYNEKEETILHNRRYYCKQCFEDRPMRDEYWSTLFDYICFIFNIDKPTGLIFQQIKNYKSEPYNFTDKGIYLTLKYCIEILDMDFESYGKGIGIVPYYYEATKNHHIAISDLEDKIEELSTESELKTIRVNKIDIPFKTRKIMEYDIDWSEDEIDYEQE